MANASQSVTLPHGGVGNAFSISLPKVSLVPSWTTLLLLIVTALAIEQYVYRSKKRHLPGDSWTIPLIGRFADSLNPDIENYKRGWKFPLSAVSVFNMCARRFRGLHEDAQLAETASSSCRRRTSRLGAFSTVRCTLSRVSRTPPSKSCCPTTGKLPTAFLSIKAETARAGCSSLARRTSNSAKASIASSRAVRLGACDSLSGPRSPSPRAQLVSANARRHLPPLLHVLARRNQDRVQADADGLPRPQHGDLAARVLR